MKVVLNNGVEITCTVDEFEELYVRGLLGDVKPENFNEPLQPGPAPASPQPNKIFIDPNEATITAYGCGMPNSFNSTSQISATGDTRLGFPTDSTHT